MELLQMQQVGCGRKNRRLLQMQQHVVANATTLLRPQSFQVATVTGRCKCNKSCITPGQRAFTCLVRGATTCYAGAMLVTADDPILPANRHEQRRRWWATNFTDQSRKERARRIAKRLLKLGRITRQPCTTCGSTNAEMHHPDYAQPWAVVWLCHRCHMQGHMRKVA